MDSYLTSRWIPPTPIARDRLKDVLSLADGVTVSITTAKTATVRSGVFTDGSVYVSEIDRTCGMKITGAGEVSLWDNLTLSGTTDTDAATGERVLRVSAVSKTAGAELGTLGMANRTCSASGQLVRVWGRVKVRTSAYFILDDGSVSPVRVQTDGLVSPLASIPNVGDYVSATGPASLSAGGVPVVRVRSDTDIQVY